MSIGDPSKRVGVWLFKVKNVWNISRTFLQWIKVKMMHFSKQRKTSPSFWDKFLKKLSPRLLKVVQSFLSTRWQHILPWSTLSQSLIEFFDV